jgi:hypothetical protein
MRRRSPVAATGNSTGSGADHDRDDREQSRRPVHEVGITPASGKRFYSVPLHRRCRGHNPQAYPRADLPARPSRSAASGSRQIRARDLHREMIPDRVTNGPGLSTPQRQVAQLELLS